MKSSTAQNSEKRLISDTGDLKNKSIPLETKGGIMLNYHYPERDKSQPRGNRLKIDESDDYDENEGNDDDILRYTREA